MVHFQHSYCITLAFKFYRSVETIKTIRLHLRHIHLVEVHPHHPHYQRLLPTLKCCPKNISAPGFSFRNGVFPLDWMHLPVVFNFLIVFVIMLLKLFRIYMWESLKLSWKIELFLVVTNVKQMIVLLLTHMNLLCFATPLASEKQHFIVVLDYSLHLNSEGRGNKKNWKQLKICSLSLCIQLPFQFNSMRHILLFLLANLSVRIWGKLFLTSLAFVFHSVTSTQMVCFGTLQMER